MSVVAWDGRILAADCMAISGELKFKTSKIRRLDSGAVVSFVSNVDAGLAMIRWYDKGAKPEEWPACQRDNERWAHLIVFDYDGCRHYEQEPIPMEVHSPFMAWGSGRDFAMGAMARGATAIEAVTIANEFCVSCGFGYSAYALQGEILIG